MLSNLLENSFVTFVLKFNGECVMKLNAVYFSFEFVCVKCCNFGLKCVPYIQSRVFGIRANFSITGFMS